jgi:quinol monooxygenase YgiN
VVGRLLRVSVVAVAEMFGIAGRRRELVALLGDAERWAAAQAGCRRYTFAAALADPERFVMVSEWDSMKALDAHYLSQEFADFQFGLDELLARPSKMTVYSVAESVRPLNTRPIDPRHAD